MVIVGITGKARSGKDTVADILVKEHAFVKLWFSYPLKEAAMYMFGLSNYQLYGGGREDVIPWLGVSTRHILTTLGTEWGRALIHQNLWTILTERKLNQLKDKGCKRVVLCDVRFDDEADMLRKHGGVLIEVNRESAGSSKPDHISEKGVLLSDHDYKVFNDYSLEELYSGINFLTNLILEEEVSHE